MEIVLEVPDKDAARVLELLKGIKRVKVKSPKTTPKRKAAEFLEELKQSIEDVKRHQRGEIELQSWDELYEELKAAEPTDIAEASVSLLSDLDVEQTANLTARKHTL